MTLEKQGRLMDDLKVLNKLAVKTAAYSATLRDRVILADSSGGTFAITMPNVSEFEGKFLTVVCTDGDLTNKVTFSDTASADFDRLGVIELTEAGQGVIFYSDGIRFHIMAQDSTSESRKLTERFDRQPMSGQADGTIAASTDTQVNVCQGNLLWERLNVGAQTVLAPILSVDGWDISGVQTDDLGVELTLGITARSPAAYVVGTDAFYMKVQFSIADVSGTDDMLVGFRLAEAYQAAVDNYNDMAALNVISGDIKIETIVGGAATTTTDTTDNWADLATHELAVFVDVDGAVTYTIDGAAPTTTAAFSLTDGIVVVPFISALQSSDLSGAINCKFFECGLQ